MEEELLGHSLIINKSNSRVFAKKNPEWPTSTLNQKRAINYNCQITWLVKLYGVNSPWLKKEELIYWYFNLTPKPYETL